MNFVSGLLYNILTMLRCILRSELAKCISILMSLREKILNSFGYLKILFPEIYRKYTFFIGKLFFFSSNKSSLSWLMLNK